MSRVLFFGHSGWIGSQLYDLLIQQGYEVIKAQSRLEDYGSLIKEIEKNKDCSYCVIGAGKVGSPNIDSFEDDHAGTLRVNVIGTSIICDLCSRFNIHTTFLSSGCIYEYDDQHPIGGQGFTEEDVPNFAKSYYSKTKIMVETIVKEFPNVLCIRIRMPISSDLSSRSFLTKISKYPKVVNVPNSCTVLDDFIPIFVEMMKRKLTGIYNCTNPGVMSHNEMLTLYRDIVKPDYIWENFTLEEQAKVLRAGRSNNKLEVNKLLKEFPDVPSIQESMVSVLNKMKVSS